VATICFEPSQSSNPDESESGASAKRNEDSRPVLRPASVPAALLVDQAAVAIGEVEEDAVRGYNGMYSSSGRYSRTRHAWTIQSRPLMSLLSRA
jgi:hypothetical protein